jgi:hypothetical protein
MKKVEAQSSVMIFYTIYAGFAILIKSICGLDHSLAFMLIIILMLLIESIKNRRDA